MVTAKTQIRVVFQDTKVLTALTIDDDAHESVTEYEADEEPRLFAGRRNVA